MSIATNTEVVFCMQKLEDRSSGGDGELNGFGFLLTKTCFIESRLICLHQLTSCWLLFTPNKGLTNCQAEGGYSKLRFGEHDVILAFGALVSSHRFKCAVSNHLFQSHGSPAWTVFFAKWNAFVTIGTDRSEFTIKPDHIDVGRGIIIDASSNNHISIYICLRGSVDQHISSTRGKGKLSGQQKEHDAQNK